MGRVHGESHVAQVALDFQRFVESLLLKFDALSDTNKQWAQGLEGQMDTDIRDRRGQLNVALDKKDELIRLVEGMQQDLTCALALRGRGGICEHKVRVHTCEKCKAKLTGTGRPLSPGGERARTPGRICP